MCGIFGYVGKENNSSIGIEALKRLEYRGYDSCGIAVFNAVKKNIGVEKVAGRISELEKKIAVKGIKGSAMIGHSRWATHGSPTVKNAHPHWDCHKDIHLVHNGIIENYKQIKDRLSKKGHKFISETDTEVLCHLIEEYATGSNGSKSYTLEEAVRRALGHVRGTYGIAVISKSDPNKIVAARMSSPLLIGVNDGEYVIASDPAAVITHTNKVIYLEDGDIAVLTKSGFRIADLNRAAQKRVEQELDWDVEEAQKGGYPHFMLKEIFEQPESLQNSIRGRLIQDEGMARLGGLEPVKERIKSIERVNILGCGTAYHAGLIGEYMFEEYAGVPCEVDFSAEFRYRKPIIDKNTAAIFVSQSGETADTLGALREAKEKGALCLGIVNTVGSSIVRMTDAGVYNHAGPEIGVASTKAFTSQLVVLALLTLYLGRLRGMSYVLGERIAKEIAKLPELTKTVLKQDNHIKEIAEKYKGAKSFLFIGRKYNYPIALEGALKLKEISYIHAEGLSAGELKHGHIALIDKNVPTIAIATRDSVYEKMLSNIQEIKARGGPVIAITTKGNTKLADIVDDIIYVPKNLEMLSPILTVIPLQLFAYHVAALNGRDVDKPRNLAKSVTVE
ncbi:MAG: glutamine--fructose-6-phosphate aminotransferase [Candidatus Spechtbacteria bacterium RIFCSPHIGHO2_01_FULL_43_30]|uniref:Glutamine--fructose-6-phosphate aminotransferase [isomerizing] n=1 Tax=Candidatus Spechtbacteria bacterium RIFCSPHIGHO2_01_FULL_43_30 TaxID=1802158 RepID=A0A1G2H6R1_9BACT|nr:MAG: glutamine--fructose-6-phosphate aminotransferase [Candidatus Spechtbacteria bacterium RIFCSPHIGHO2_01_FULL_43_30]